MRLYTLTGATALDDAEYGKFEADENGGFDFPDDVSDRLVSFHVGGWPMWETDTERQRRLVLEEMDRRKDPATLLSAVEQLVRAAQATAALTPIAAQATEAGQQLVDTLQKSETGDGDGTPPVTPPADKPKAARGRAAAKPTE
ncbi:hypothetical protein ABZ619_38805 [Streptomyces sp. NPDC007851]|uniref:hypothetical protein n=1 Tax=Streptomyces sp. NPDC007851 TaxID=3155008 RepID=UPI0034016062